MTGPKKHRRILRWVALGLVLALLVCVGIYLGTCYRATPEALRVISEPARGVTVRELPGQRIDFIPEEPVAGLIFYPGGKVQYEAYAPLMEACAREGILCVLLHVPCNLAVFSPNAADGVAEDYPELERWYVGGHSLGGVMAASYAASHAEALEGAVLLAAWSTEDLRDSGLAVLSLVGTEDGVLNLPKYEAEKCNLPPDAAELILEGGNHAQFGSYGPQRGDGEARITPEEQWAQSARAIAVWVTPAVEKENLP